MTVILIVVAKGKSASAEDIERRLREAALTLLEQDGAASLTARKIAGAAGRTTMCIYSHFGSISALLGNLYQDLGRQVRTAISGADTPAAALASWSRRQPGSYRLAFVHDLGPLGIDPAERAQLLADVAAVFGSFEALAKAHGLISVELAATPALEPPADYESWQAFTDAQLA